MKILVILLMPVFIFFTTKIYAESSNAVYQFINDHEYLLVPLSDAAAGLSLCGPWCALAGGAAGIADEGLIYYGYTDKRYFTYGILGDTPGLNTLTNDDKNKMHGFSGWFGYYPVEETIALKLGVEHITFNYANGSERDGETTLKLQLLFSLGPHKAHTF